MSHLRLFWQKWVYLWRKFGHPLFFVFIVSLGALVQASVLASLSPQPQKPPDPIFSLQPRQQEVPAVYLPLILLHPEPTPLPGAPKVPCTPTGGTGGLRPGTYKTEVAGLASTVIIGEGYSPDQPTYLSFFIHGNDGDVDRFRSRSNPVNQLVNKYGWVFVAPHTPKKNSWSTPFDERLNEAFAKALDEMFARYNVCRETVIGSGASGGAIFWTKYFFPKQGQTYPAHISLLCGAWEVGIKARQRLNLLGQDPVVVANSTFDYIYGPLDYLTPNILDSIYDYTTAGLKVEQLVIEGGGHCNEWPLQGLPNSSQRIADDWEARIVELGLEEVQVLLSPKK